MLISLKHRYAFFCTPKCASNSIEAMLKPHAEIHLLGSPQVRHTNARQYEEWLQPYLREVSAGSTIERIAVIREPVDWLYSWYRFRARSALRESESANSTAHLDFGEFVDSYLQDPQPPYAQVGSQLEFLLDKEGRLGVDSLYAYDKLDALAADFSARVGQTLSLRAINVSPGKVYKSNVLEKLGAVLRRLQAQRAAGAGVGTGSKPDARAELDSPRLAALEAHFAEEMKLYAAAQAAPLRKTEWDGRHSDRPATQI